MGSGQLGWIMTTVPPEVRCVGGVPTGGFPSCSPGTQRSFGRGEQSLWALFYPSESVASMLTGPLTFVVNCNFNENYRGPCWGTFTWVVGDGTWEGHWTAPVMDLMTYETRLSMVGFGRGDGLDGKQLKVDGSSNPGDWFVAVNIRIMD
jgi:hypothetical protein